MANRVYDDQKHKHNSIPSDDELRRLTGIDEEQEGAMDREAYNSQAEQILAQEQAAARGQVGTQTQGVANPDPQIQRGGFGVPNKPGEAQGSGVVRGGFGSTAAAHSQTELKTAEDDAVGRGYTGDPNNHRQGRFKNVRKKWAILGGGMAGLVGAVTISMTPIQLLQAIHASEMLQDHDFSSVDQSGNFTTMSLLRYAYYSKKGTVERTRLGVTGNKLADIATARFQSIGLDPVYTDVLGYGDGFKVDRSAPRWREFGTDEALKQHFKEKFGMELTPGKEFGGSPALQKSGVFVVDTRPGKVGYFALSKFVRTTLQLTGLNRISATILSSMARQRFGVTLHPIKKKLQKSARATEADYQAMRKERAERTRNGSYNRPTIQAVEGDERTPPEQREAARNAAQAGETTVNDGAATSEALKTGSATALKNFKATINSRWTSGGVLAASIPCIMRGLAADAGNIKQAQVIAPLIRMGFEAISLGEQSKSGVDMTGDQLGFYDRLATGKDARGQQSTWTDARPIQAMSGNPNGGKQSSKTLRTISKGTPFDFLLANPYDPPLKVYCSPVVQTGIMILQFAGGQIVGVLSGLLVGALTQPLLDEAAQWMAGSAIDPDGVGEEYGSNIAYGSRLASNDQALSMGGGPVSKEAEQRIDNFGQAAVNEEFQSKSLAYRLFNPRDYRTPVGKFIDRQNSRNVFANINGIAQSFLNVGDSFGSTLLGAFGGRSYAANTSYDYGFTRIAIDPAIFTRPEYANPYETGERAANILDSGIGQPLIDKAKRCKGILLAKDSNNLWNATTSPDGPPLMKDSTADECKTSSDKNWELISVFINSTVNANALSCKFGDSEGCAFVGFGDNAVASTPGGTPVGGGGDAKAIAAQIFAKSNGPNPTIKFQTNAKKTAFEQIVNTGAQQACGTSIPISTELLNVLLKASETYGIVIGVFAAGHGCDGMHMKGMAVDINGVSKGNVSTGNFFHINEMNPAQLALAREFYSYLSNISPVKTGGLGQAQCFRPLPPLSPNVSFFPDSCDHLHYDVRKNQ